MPLPSGVKVEVEFTGGVWTDVTPDVDYNSGWQIRVGRASASGSIQPGSVSFVLRNPTGKYTPGVQQLYDSTTNTYSLSTTYPNVVPRKRVRISNSSGVRFVGYVKSWTPPTNGFPGSSFCTVVAQDRLDPLSRIVLQAPIRQEIITANPTLYWPLTDASGATAAAEDGGGPALTLQAAAQNALTFGSDGPVTGDGTSVLFAPSAISTGQFLQTTALASAITLTGDYTIAVPVNCHGALPSWGSSGGNIETVLSIGTPGGAGLSPNRLLDLRLSNGSPAFLGTSGFGVAAGSIVDSNWHMLVLRFTGGTATLYVDGVSSASSANTAATFTPTVLRVGDGLPDPVQFTGRFQGSIGQLALWPSALTPTQIANLGWAVSGFTGASGTETPDLRIKRWLGYAGLTAPDYNLTASLTTLGTYPQDGKDIASAMQDMAATEGGGSAVYVLAGVVQFTTRYARNPGTATLTITAGQDDAASGYTPTEDDATLVNQVTVNRANALGTVSTQTAQDAGSITANGLATGSDITTYVDNDADALALAQSIVAAGRTPAWRLPQVTVDLLTSVNNLYAAVQNTVIGSKITVQTLPAGQAPATTVNLRVEGWTETVKNGQYSITYDTTADDNPARALASDATYGSAQCDGQTLNASLTNSATTVVIATSGGKATFTTNGAMYPLKITVGAERMTLNNAPGGSTTPQTFTGVTRGVDGTTASAQASGATVTIWPRITATL